MRVLSGVRGKVPRRHFDLQEEIAADTLWRGYLPGARVGVYNLFGLK
jgi:hypothetical protein